MAAKHPKRSTSFLPLEIIETILLNLPVESLLRFKTVSKSWNTMISDPAFVENQLHRSKTSSSRNLLLGELGFSHYNSEDYSLVKIDKDRKLQTLQLSEYPPGSNVVLSYCDGVLLLTNDRQTCMDFVLWNPSTGTHATFQFPYEVNPRSQKIYGLCHDPRTGGFKVVVVVCLKYYTVYSCKNNSWTRKKEFGDTSFLVVYDPHIFVDGVFYLLLMDPGIYLITYFDPVDDEFKILRKPEIVVDHLWIYMADLKGRLCVYCNANDGRGNAIRIWIKGEGVGNNYWEELITIENVPTYIWFFKPLCFVENKILIQLYSSRLVLYNPSEKTFEKFDIERSSVYCEYFPYLDSLIDPGAFFPAQEKEEVVIEKLISCS
ncbi:hypothetical protein MIMGU_mgv1a024301mg [Erythranthe guttata]|uniref:F-box domain-containing protein n=1 Tax=Erythranthe guttata TaxID=4155 RepID=A0A022RNT2_ERYGU|nr:PREDICTED: F-box protein CPR30-like [Erythranthe guttata]EYU40590.1 hypothetical protein MIMGU_mgv1a024301mg [Erythranthe guttata]|eukprot:XP_012833495.1 PREDICTED: F-box protein CPR30-like [Erythranthe guttata]